MRRHLRNNLLKLYVPLLIVVAAAVLSTFAPRVNWIGFVASGITIAHFVQRDRHEALQRFHQLFTQFNARYDELNERLQDISDDTRHLTTEDRATLIDYFNLCGEEYFFFSQGIIPRSVWRSWCHGIAFYLSDDRIARVWDHEEASGSYYGLTREAILQETGPQARVLSASPRPSKAA